MGIKNIAILGDGGWGTTLAVMLSKKGYSLTLWGAFRDYVAYLEINRINKRFLPGIKIPKQVKITGDLKGAVSGRDLIIIAVPSQYVRGILKKLKLCGLSKKVLFLSVSKGIEVGTLNTVSQIIYEELGRVKLAVLSGPTIAKEVAEGGPTAAVIASSDKFLRDQLQSVFIGKRFRVYTNSDMLGVELGGSLKNIIAIACGISDGLGFGTNSKAAILSRGMVEITKFGSLMGADSRTFYGISGLGDLVTTCISPYSRNRFVGEQIAKGKSLRQIAGNMKMIAEGVATTKSAYQLSLRFKIDMPITREVYKVLYKGKSPLKAVDDLMKREMKPE